MPSITGCLHSRQPIPALRQPCCTHSLCSRPNRPDAVATPGTCPDRRHRCAARAPDRSACVRIFFASPSGVLAQRDRVAVGLGHLLAVEPGMREASVSSARARPGSSCRCLRDSRTGARDRPATGSALVEQRMRRSGSARRRPPAGSGCAARRRAARLLPSFLTAPSPCPRNRLAAVQVIEAARDLARELDVRHLVLAHRHLVGAVDQDVGRLQQRIAEKAVGRQILVSSFSC
jgi:hypothetical protein